MLETGDVGGSYQNRTRIARLRLLAAHYDQQMEKCEPRDPGAGSRSLIADNMLAHFRLVARMCIGGRTHNSACRNSEHNSQHELQLPRQARAGVR